MRANATTIFRATMLGAALVTVALTGLWSFAAAADSVDCNPATCTSPVMGPGYHLDVRDPVAPVRPSALAVLTLS
jgi:hypothetical protein